MWSLCALCVLLSLVPGLNTGGGDHTEMYVRPGSDVLLPLSYNLAIDKTIKRCDGFEWLFERSKVSAKISKSKGCEILDYNNATHLAKHNTLVLPFSDYYTSADGTLTLINVTWENSGNYNVIVYNPAGSPIFNQTYTLHVQAPVSEPFLNVSCRHDGGADIICGTDTGEDLSFSIMVNKGLLLKNANSSKKIGSVSKVHTAAASPGPWDITCSMRNRVSKRETRRTNVICPVPLSNPVLEASCLNNGSLNISCSVENGTDPIFSLNVNGTLFSANVKKGVKSVNHVTVSSPEPWDVHCYVNSSLGWKNATTNITCPVPLSDPVLNVSCHHDSLLEISCSVENGTDPIFSLSVNGELIFKNDTPSKRVNVTVSISAFWDVHCSVRNNLGEKNTSKSYKTCLVPISALFINSSCQSDGTARVVCEAAEGSDATYNWTINGELILWDTVPVITIHTSEFASGAKNVSCSTENSISKTRSNDTKVFCDAPVSQPLLNVACLSNGSAMITCSVLSGTNPKFHMTVNGSILTPYNTSSSCCGYNYITSPGGTWNISCSVGNELGDSTTSNSSHSSCGPKPKCSTCLRNSIIGGVVALIVTTSPLLIATIYIERNTRQKKT